MEVGSHMVLWMAFTLVVIKYIQYAIIVIACTLVLIFQIAKCFEKYFDKNTGTADKYVHVSTTPFPELSICPTYPYKLDNLQSNGIATRNKIQFGSLWISNNSNITPQSLYQGMNWVYAIKCFVHICGCVTYDVIVLKHLSIKLTLLYWS